MTQLIEVLISNRSFRRITLDGLVIKPLRKDQPFQVGNVDRIKRLIQEAYPIDLSLSLAEEQKKDINKHINIDNNTDNNTDNSGDISNDINCDTNDDINKGNIDDTLKTISIETLELSTTVEKNLKASGVEFVSDLTKMTEKDVIDVKGIADAGLSEIKDALAKINLTLKGVDDE